MIASYLIFLILDWSFSNFLWSPWHRIRPEASILHPTYGQHDTSDAIGKVTKKMRRSLRKVQQCSFLCGTVVIWKLGHWKMGKLINMFPNHQCKRPFKYHIDIIFYKISPNPPTSPCCFFFKVNGSVWSPPSRGCRRGPPRRRVDPGVETRWRASGMG